MVQGPEAAADPVHQVPLLLPGKLHGGALLLEGGGQLGPGVGLILDEIVDEHQAYIVRQVGEQGRQGLLVPRRGLEQVIIVHQHHGPWAHHGQGVDLLGQPFGVAVPALHRVEVELLQPGGHQFGLHLAQIIVPEVGLLPVEHIQPADGPGGDILLELFVGGAVPALFWRHILSPLAHRNGDGPLQVGAVDHAVRPVQPEQGPRRRVSISIIPHRDQSGLR